MPLQFVVTVTGTEVIKPAGDVAVAVREYVPAGGICRSVMRPVDELMEKYVLGLERL